MGIANLIKFIFILAFILILASIAGQYPSVAVSITSIIIVIIFVIFGKEY